MIRCLACTLALVILSVCSVSGETLLEKNWGTSYRLALSNQILTPESVKNLWDNALSMGQSNSCVFVSLRVPSWKAFHMRDIL